MKRRILLLCALSLGALPFVGCSDADDGGPQPVQDFKVRGLKGPTNDARAPKQGVGARAR
jgi:hypothetical protein